MSDETKIHSMAVLRRDPDNRYSLVIRWLLGNKEALPCYDDTFHVQALLNRSKRVLKADGSLSDPEENIWIPVKPRNFAMIDPPREIEEIGETSGGEKQYRLKSKKPSGPIDPGAAASGSLRVAGTNFRESHSVGVFHILSEVEPSVEAWRVAKTLSPVLRDKMYNLTIERALFLGASKRAGSAENFADTSAAAFAIYLVGNGTRPIDLPHHISNATAQFRESLTATRITGGVFSGMPKIFALPGAELQDQVAYAALIAAGVNNESVLLELDDIIKERTQARQQLRLRALQGGELIDYWCDPDQFAATCPEAHRGMRYPASELLGMGITISGITSEDLAQWIADREMLTVTVRHEPADPVGRADTSFEVGVQSPGHLAFDTLQQYQWGPGLAPKLAYAKEFQRALDDGGSHLPPGPAGAEVNYDLSQSNAGDPEAGDNPATAQRERTVAFETGDGKVQILIKPPASPDWAGPDERSKTVYAYNIYSMWEGAPGTERFFADNPEEPTLDELRPWRVSARYSYTRDLQAAFPTNGGPHPALVSALADPPWFPVLERPEVVKDPSPSEDAPEGRKLPNVGRDGMTAWSIDLRKGMKLDNPDDIDVRWDNFGPLNYDWSPELRRDGSPADGRPQRYRFWVTSVDAFEQESAPIPVQTNDQQAGEADSLFFEPRRRTPLGPPPQNIEDDGGAGKSIQLLWDQDTSQLKLNWETPFISQVAANEAEQRPPQRVEKAMLQAKVVIFRKRVKKLDTPVEVNVAPGEIQTQPQWKAVYAAMQDEKKGRGFSEYFVKDAIEPPVSGDKWTLNVDLPWHDRDFEYVAAIGMNIRDEAAKFWAPNVTSGEESEGRRLITYVPKGDDFDPFPISINETPRVSDVSETNTVVVANLTKPRGVTKSGDPSQDYQFAAPVRPVSEIRRDLVLLRMLTHDVKGRNAEEWSDTGVKLTEGQRAMCETAIQRTRQFGADPDAPRLKEVRRLLAEEFAAGRKDRKVKGKSVEDELRKADILLQHATIGFRGIRTLRWRYSSFSAQAPNVGEESEAVAFRIYQVRVPIARDDAAVYATFRGFAKKESADSYRMSQVEAGSQEAIQSIAKLGQPAVAWFKSEPTAETRTVLLVSDSDTDHPMITINDGVELPEASEVMIFAAQPIVEVPIDVYSRRSKDYSVDLPVGGGLPEIFHWWVVTVSAQGLEAGPDRRAHYSYFAPMTIEPEPPAVFNVTPPTDRQSHLLDPHSDDNKPFLPQRIWSDGDRALNNPRLLVSWQDPRKEARATLVLRRRRMKVNEDDAASQSIASFADTMTSWQALKSIEVVEAGKPLEPTAIEVLKKTWLQGVTVVPDSDARLSGADLGHTLIGPEKALSSEAGLLNIADPNTPDGVRPAFVDYFYKADDPIHAMEGSYLYSHSAARAIDLDPDGVFDLEADERYLYSRWTGWTPFQTPGTPAFEIIEGVAKQQLIEPYLSPIVEFRIATRPLQEALLLDDEKDPIQIREWFYKVIIRRRVDQGMPPGDGTPFQAEWVEVGVPIRVDYNKPAISIIDDVLERTEPDDALFFIYKISATQMAVVEDLEGNKIDEVMVRRGTSKDGGEKEVEIEIPPMLSRDQQSGPRELLHEQKISVDVQIV